MATDGLGVLKPNLSLKKNIDEVTDYTCACCSAECIGNTKLYPLSKITRRDDIKCLKKSVNAYLPGKLRYHLLAKNGRPFHRCIPSIPSVFALICSATTSLALTIPKINYK